VWIIIPRYPNTRTYTTVLAATPSFTNAPDSDSKIIYAFRDVVHLGDDDYGQGWESLFGTCFDMSVPINLPLQTLTMELEIYGEESRNAVILNGNQVVFIPPQGGTQDAWSKSPVIISVPIDKIVDGNNTVSICAEEAVYPDYPGELDDFQIRSINIIARAP